MVQFQLIVTYLLSSSNSSVSASQVAGIMPSHPLISVFLVEMEFHHVGQAGLQLLTSSDLPTPASRVSATAPGLF